MLPSGYGPEVPKREAASKPRHQLLGFDHVVTRGVKERDIGAGDDFRKVDADWFDFVVVTDVAVVIQRRRARKAGRPTSLFDGYREEGKQHDDGNVDYQRDPCSLTTSVVAD